MRAVHVGADRNGDGVLQDDEIQSTSYACFPGNPATIEGDVTVNNSIDAAALVGVTTITGDLTINAPSLQSIDLSALESLGGSLHVLGFDNPHLTVNAVTIGHDIDVQGASGLTELEFPRLSSVTGSIVIDHAPHLTNLTVPELVTIGDNLYIGNSEAGPVDEIVNQSLATLSFPKLTTIASQWCVAKNPALTSVAFPKLTSVSEALDANLAIAPDPDHVPGFARNPQLASLDLSALITVGDSLFIQNSAITSLDLSALSSVKNTIDLSSNPLMTSFDLSALESTGMFSSTQALFTEISLPSLTTADQGITITSDDQLASVSLPALTSAGTLYVDYLLVLTTVDLPLLTTTSGGINLNDNPQLATISLPQVTTIHGPLAVGDDTALATLDVPVATSMGAFIVDASVPHLTTVSFPKLEHATGGFGVDHATKVTSLSVPLLATVGYELDAPTVIYGQVYIAGASKLTDVSLPSLVNSPGGLECSTNTHMTTFSAPLLNQVSTLTFDGDAALATLSLPALGTIDSFIVTSNDTLTSISVAQSARATSVSIVSNRAFSACAAGDLATQMHATSITTIDDGPC